MNAVVAKFFSHIQDPGFNSLWPSDAILYIDLGQH